MAQDAQPPVPAAEKSKFSLRTFFKKYWPAFAMSAAAIVLLLPLVFFVSSTLEKRIDVVKNPPPKQEIFYPGAPYAEDQLIVKYKDKYTLDEILNLKNSLESLGVTSQKKVFDSDAPDLKNIYLLTFKKGVDLKGAAVALSALSEIEAVGANYIVKAQAVKNNDPGFSNQWDLVKIQMPQAWDITRGSNSVRVAVIDTGIDYGHQDFAGRTVVKGPDLTKCATYKELSGGRIQCVVTKSPDRDPIDNDNRGHGTHVSGTIGAMVNNGAGIAGVNWNVSLMAIKTNGGLHGDGYVDDVIEGVRYAVDNGAKVINMSLSAPIPCNNQNVIGYKEVLKHAADRGVTVVVAAGNHGKDANLESPASCTGVITVGATDANDKRWSSSNFGLRVDISAPGVGILSTMPDNQYAFKDGTSMAAPHVAGVAALLLSASPNLTPSQIKDCLVKNADSINTDKPIGPRLNAFKALTACSDLPPATPTVASSSASPSAMSVPPTSAAKSGGTPKASGPSGMPAKTYTCREKTSSRSPAGAIQIGDLECVPNP